MTCKKMKDNSPLSNLLHQDAQPDTDTLKVAAEVLVFGSFSEPHCLPLKCFQ